MDGPTLQTIIYKGYAKAAKIIGISYNLYRPLSAMSPLGNLVGTINAALDSSPSYKFTTPNEYGDPSWFALLDDATAQTGDYISNTSGTYFIAGKQFLLPVIVIDCNRTVKISRQVAEAGVGAVAYGGSVALKSVDILGGVGNFWPASILQGGRQQKNSGLPSSTQQAGWGILLPPSVPIFLEYGDIVTDDMGRIYVIESSELTDLGYRIKAIEMHT